MNDPFAEILGKLSNVTKNGDGYMALCPAHDDHRPSLSITETPDGKILVHCFAGCSHDAIYKALGMEKSKPARPVPSRIVATYDYCDENGDLLYQGVRYEPKNFKMRRPDGDGRWTWKTKGVRRVLYRLPELIASDPSKSVYICEGEKDVNVAVAVFGMVATCNVGGAGKWRKEYSEFFTGRRVRIIADKDKSGRKHAQEVAAACYGIAESIKVLEVPGEWKDLAEFQAAGGTIEQLAEAVRDAEEWVPKATSKRKSGTGDQADGGGDQDTDGEYWIGKDGGMYFLDREGHEKQITNFSGKIIQQTLQDDGIETARSLDLEVKHNGRVIRFSIPAAKFIGSIDWIVANIGGEAWINPGRDMRDRARVAIQYLSGRIPEVVEYKHTGWRMISGEPVYLHGGGAIGTRGAVPGVCVALDDGLAGYRLPTPPDGDDLRTAIRASLEMLNVAPDAITVPVYAAIWRAILGPSAFSLHVVGGSGVGKTELAALAQQHFGAGMSAKSLPASWTSTENALESQASAAKDAIWCVDDYAPGSSPVDRAKLNAKADRIFRAAGNQAGRQRMRADTSMRPARHPRGTVLSTGEDLPAGHSCRARILILEMEPGTDGMRWDRLGQCQIDAHNGLYAAALAGYVRWVAGQYAAVTGGLAAEVHEFRAKLGAGGGHKRTPEAIANLLVGLRHYFRFVREVEALPPGDVKAIADRCRAALVTACMSQPVHLTDTDPAGMFPGLLASAVASGAAHLADVGGGMPDNPAAWGWRERPTGPAELYQTEWSPMGVRIGWRDELGVYIDPQAAYRVAQAQAGGAITVQARTLFKRLAERGLVVTRDDADHLLIRKTCDGARRRVLHLRPDVLHPDGDEPDGSPGGGSEGSKNGAPDIGPVFASGPVQESYRATKSDEKPQQKCTNGPVGPVGPVYTDKAPQSGEAVCPTYDPPVGVCSTPSYAQEPGQPGQPGQTPSGATENAVFCPESLARKQNGTGPEGSKTGPIGQNHRHCDAEFERFAAQHGIEM